MAKSTDNVGIVDVKGDVEPSLSSSLYATSSLGSVNTRRTTTRRNYDKILTGDSSYVIRSRTSSSAPPSWTQFYVGFRHGHVIPALSSSRHEVSQLNAYDSGSSPLENSAVPVSASLYYSKSNRFQYKVYKLSASSQLPLTPNVEQFPSPIENLSRSLFDSVSGSYRNNSYFNPSLFTIDVPDYGKIRDVRVWVEFVHDHRGGTGTGSADASNPFWAGGAGTGSIDLRHGLQGVQVALRSPNVSFRSAHPLWNDPQTFSYLKNPDPSIQTKYKDIPELLRGSYLLWAGHAVEQDLGTILGNHTRSLPDSNLNPTVVETGSNNANYVSIALTKRDIPGIVCIESNVAHVRYFVSSSTGWTPTAVTASSGFSWSRLTYDKYDNPHILFQDSRGLVHATKISGSNSWYFTTISSDGGRSVSLEADDNGRVHYSFMRGGKTLSTPSAIAYGYIDSVSNSWSYGPITEIDSRGSTVGLVESSLFLDSSGTPYVAFWDFDRNLRVAKSASTGWQLSTVELKARAIVGNQGLSGCSFGESIFVFYARYTNVEDSVRIAQCSTSSFGDWTLKTIESKPAGNGVGPEMRAAVGSDGLPQVVYKDSSRGLKYALSGAFGFSFKYLDARPTSAEYLDIAVDSNFVPHIATQDSVSPDNQVVYRRRIGGTSGSSYYSYDTDIDMRTVFWDASRVPNPRHIGMLYESARDDSPGESIYFSNLQYTNGLYPSPLSASVSRFSIDYFEPVVGETGLLSGANFPWMLDSRIPPGNFRNRSFSAGSPPSGWLTGPGNSAAVNEFPTSGTQLGPENIQPVYPLLDDVYVERVYSEPPVISGVDQTGGSVSKRLVGFRPGLRGTEMHGKWQLLIGVNSNYAASGEMSGVVRSGIWFRQFRMEFIVDQGEGLSYSYPSKSYRFKRSSYVPSRGRRRIQILSGSAAWDIGVNYVYVGQREAYGRSVGIVDHTGSSADSFAVFTRITGTLADIVPDQNFFRTYLQNEFGTPYIPLSSGSGIAPSFDAITEDQIIRYQDLMNKVNPGASRWLNNIPSYLSRLETAKTARATVEEFFRSSGSLI